MSNSPLKVMFFKRPSKGTDRVHPDEMQWNDLLKWNEKIETWHTSICFTHQTLDFSEMPNAILGGSDPKRPGWFGNQSRKMPLTQEFTQK